MAKVLSDEMAASFDTKIAIGEYGTQFFWFNPNEQKFEYALPLVSGGEYGGDTESFDAPELDGKTVFKVGGRTTIDDIPLTSNYTKARYIRWLQIVSSLKPQAYMEVYSDGSASMYAGTAGSPRITGGDVRTIETTIAPSNMVWINDVTNVTEAVDGDKTIDQINDLLDSVIKDNLGEDASLTTEIESGDALPFDEDTIPAKRIWAYQAAEDDEEVEGTTPAQPSNP